MMLFEFRNCRITIFLIAIFIIGAAIAWSIHMASSSRDAANAEFAMYPAHNDYQGVPKTPKWGSLNVPRLYRPFIEIEARRGPNFAGEYTLVPYTCDGLCKNVFVILLINARTGKIIKRTESKKYKLKYQLNSRLLVLKARHSGKSEKIVYLLHSNDGFIELEPRQLSHF